jgi:hypothetical protein
MYQQPRDEQFFPPQREFQQPGFYYAPQPPAPPARPKNKTMKTLSIIFIAVGLALAVLSTIPTGGIVFGFLGFFCNGLGLVFICLI